MNTKAFSRVEIKDADKGEVVAVFATLNVIDSDGDVTPNGAFENGAKIRISAYGHKSWEGKLPVGKGAIRETKTEALMEGRFFMDIPEAAATFGVVKELSDDDLQEWSYGFDPVEYAFGQFEGQDVRFLNKLKVHEVSPVLLGAGVNTRTLSVKGMKFGDHLESVVADLEELVTRAAEVVALRSEKGKAISEASASQLARVAASAKRLEDLLAAPATTSADDLQREFARFVAITQGA